MPTRPSVTYLRPARAAVLRCSEARADRIVRVLRLEHREAQPQPERGEARGDAQHDVEHRDPRLAALHEEHGHEAEGGEGREAAQQAGEEQQADVRGKELVLLREPGEDSRDEASQDIDRERAGGESPVDRVVQHVAGKLEARDRSDGAAQRDQQDALHSMLPSWPLKRLERQTTTTTFPTRDFTALAPTPAGLG